MYTPLIGLEVEFHLIDDQGRLMSKADSILKDSETPNTILKELSHSMIEVISDPSDDLAVLIGNIEAEVKKASYIANKHGLFLLPSTCVGNEYPKPRISPRYQGKEKILGMEKRKLEYQICGTHIHVDKHDDLVKQHTLMTAMDPAFNFMSSSPFLLAQNTFNNHRVGVYRNFVFEQSPIHGALLPYVYDLKSLNQRYKHMFDSWLEKCSDVGIDSTGFTSKDTCWGPVRLSDKTIESRSADTNLFSNVAALTALYLGCHRQLDSIQIIEGDNPGYKNNVLTIPRPAKLKEFETNGALHGLCDTEIRYYLHSLTKLAEDGLKDHEKKYLEPFKRMLATGTNFSDEIISYSVKHGLYNNGSLVSPAAVDKVRQYIGKRFLDDLKNENNYVPG